jgi:oxygen-dependent protoporphyrinogen oxidase
VDANRSSRPPVIAVIGGGISGLAAARRVAELRPDAEVLVLEAADRVGGKLRREQVGGAWVDVGAEAMLARRPEGVAAIAEAGLAADLISPLTTAALLRNRGQNRPLPPRTLIGIPSDAVALRASGLLTEESLERIEQEPDSPAMPALTDDISVGDLVQRRFGAEVVDRLVDPLLGGVYAGRAREISLQASVAGLAQRLSVDGGSLLTATASVVAAAGGPTTSPTASPATSQPAVFASVAGGLARLPQELAASPRLTVQTGRTVRSIRRTPSGFSLALGPAGRTARADTYELAADAVIVAVPAAKSAQLLSALAPAAAAELSAIETASMAIVTLAFDDAQELALPPGSGILIPSIEGLSVKAMTFSSQKWPGVGAESGVRLMRASLGRAGEEWALQREDSELVATVLAELRAITGVSRMPVDTHVQRWGGALPQYEVGHLRRVARIRRAVAEVKGLAVCGATYDGVGIPACVAAAHAAADRIAAELDHDLNH